MWSKQRETDQTEGRGCQVKLMCQKTLNDMQKEKTVREIVKSGILIPECINMPRDTLQHLVESRLGLVKAEGNGGLT